MKVLVTGGSGFIGTRLVSNLLEEGHEVVIFDKAESKCFPELVYLGDVRDLSALSEACKGVDVIYNLAAEHADNVSPCSLYYDVNCMGAENVTKAAKENEVKSIVFTSSVAVYGLDKDNPSEETKPEPFNEYGKTKLEAENILCAWAAESVENSLTIVRPSVVFGEGNRGNVYNLINQIVSGSFLMVGAGNNFKSMSYVKNVAKFLMGRIESPQGVNIYNYADKPDLSSKEIVGAVYEETGIKGKPFHLPYTIGLIGGLSFDLLAKLTGRKFSVSSIRIKKFCANTTVNSQKAMESGFSPEYTIEAGLKRMVREDFPRKSRS
ncbi:NAD-dependent epimerase/dehydratase family protein [Ferrimonas kyonanensis]|uniref:NAD-dependent epimerase/dehydratase family protein n=1 Tax=Ferrimonas kyonanensis TaxID=364763 RepID=UPI0004198B1C|nr:NAD(P)-dependent oxidoreductase [Ferrimonas kyonanensis]